MTKRGSRKHCPLSVSGLSYATWLGIAVLVWVWSSELFPTHLRGRSQGVCNAWCRLAISLNIFLVPMALAGLGFSAYMAILSVPMFLIAVIRFGGTR